MHFAIHDNPLYMELSALITEEHMSSKTDPVSTLDFHVRTKERQLRNVLDRENEAADELKKALAKHENSAREAVSDPTVDALFMQLALIDLPTQGCSTLNT